MYLEHRLCWGLYAYGQPELKAVTIQLYNNNKDSTLGGATLLACYGVFLLSKTSWMTSYEVAIPEPFNNNNIVLLCRPLEEYSA